MSPLVTNNLFRTKEDDDVDFDDDEAGHLSPPEELPIPSSSRKKAKDKTKEKSHVDVVFKGNGKRKR